MLSKELIIKQLQKSPKKIFRRLRWGKSGVVCPHCGSIDVYTKNDIHFCRDCYKKFTDTSNTVFHSTKLPLDRILLAIYYFVVNTRGISSYQLSKHIGVTQKTAWRLLTRIRECISQDLVHSGDIILDELYLGGSITYKPLKKKLPQNIYTNYKDYTPQELKQRIFEYASECKMPVLGIIGETDVYGRVSVSLRYIPTSVSRKNVQELLKGKINPQRLITDQAPMYSTIAKSYGVPHSVCDHSKFTYKSTDGYSSTRVEGLFSQVRRMFSGTYTWCSRKHLQGYLDELSLRYNLRGYPPKYRFEYCMGLLFS